MADPNRTVPQKDRYPNDENPNRPPRERQRSRREPAAVAHDQGERIRRRRTGDDEPPTAEGHSDVADHIEDEGLGAPIGSDRCTEAVVPH